MLTSGWLLVLSGHRYCNGHDQMPGQSLVQLVQAGGYWYHAFLVSTIQAFRQQGVYDGVKVLMEGVRKLGLSSAE